jgi:alkylation response protein AidB-like acyl-CoA dehydrogenase
MEFLLNEEKRIFQKTMRRFCEEQIRPVIEEIDREQRFPYEIYDKLVGIGLPGTNYPMEYGGVGLDLLTLILGLEEISRISMGMAMAQGWILYCPPVFYFGNDEQKKEYFVPVLRGEKKGCFALTEPNAGSDAGSLMTKAKRAKNGYIINGTKMFITVADVSDYIVLAARTGNMEDKHRGISLFLVDSHSKGILVKKLEKIGAGAASTCEISFEDVYVPFANLLGIENRGFYALMKILDHFRVLFGTMSLGVAQGAYEEALNYAKKREAFGKTISKFQAIQFMLADMYTQIEASRLMIYRAAWMIDHGKSATKEASAAKLMASEMAMSVTVKAMQVFGGYGYMLEFPIQRYFREAKLGEVGEGTSEIQRMIIAKQLGL